MYNGLVMFSYVIPEISSERIMRVEESQAAPEILAMYPSLIDAPFPLAISQVYG